MPHAERTAPDALALVLALRRLPPREAQLLTLRFVEGLGRGGVAKAYGVSPAVVPVHTLRAARLLQAALAPSGGAPLLPLDAKPRSDVEDAREAAALESSLDAAPEPGREVRPGDPPGASSEVAGLALSLRALTLHASEVRRLTAELEARQRASPARRRADLLRRVAVVALVALALWLYLGGGK